MLLLSLGCSAGPVAALSLSVDAGQVPLTVELDGSGTTDASRWSWTVEGQTYDGETARHTFRGSGTFEVELSVLDDKEREDVAVATVTVEPPACPSEGEVSETGEVEDEDLWEISGVVEGRDNGDILWVHNDAGHQTRIYAIGLDGSSQGRFKLKGAETGDVEDIGIYEEDGQTMLVVADVGDNNKVRDAIRIYLVPEPDIGDGTDDEKLEDYRTLTVSYPGGAEDCETAFADPVTGDLYLVTKDYGGSASLFRKVAPHTDGEVVELEEVMTWDLGEATTGGDISPEGHLLVVRTYTRTAFAWTIDRTDGFVESLQQDPTCELELPGEQQGEAVGFGADGSGLWTVSEGTNQPIRFTALD